MTEEFRLYLQRANGYTHVRQLDETRYAAVMPLLFTGAIIVGRIGDRDTYDDRWCYLTIPKAAAALERWDGAGEPDGWHRHPATGRRRELDEEGQLLAELVRF